MSVYNDSGPFDRSFLGRPGGTKWRAHQRRSAVLVLRDQFMESGIWPWVDATKSRFRPLLDAASILKCLYSAERIEALVYANNPLLWVRR